MMEQKSHISELVNYETPNSNSVNYSTFHNSSCRESFPVLMENGILVMYESLEFSSDLMTEVDNSLE